MVGGQAFSSIWLVLEIEARCQPYRKATKPLSDELNRGTSSKIGSNAGLVSSRLTPGRDITTQPFRALQSHASIFSGLCAQIWGETGVSLLRLEQSQVAVGDPLVVCLYRQSRLVELCRRRLPSFALTSNCSAPCLRKCGCCDSLCGRLLAHRVFSHPARCWRMLPDGGHWN